MKALIIKRIYPPPMIIIKKLKVIQKNITTPQQPLQKKTITFCPIWIRKNIS